MTGNIQLTPDERSTAQPLNDVHWNMNNLGKHGFGDQCKALSAMADLMEGLLARNAIPSRRWDLFTLPELNVGGRFAVREVFEQNGTKGVEIYRHAHFLPWLHYFIFGTTLPDNVKHTFAEAIERCGNITSGDLRPLSQLARSLAKQCNDDSFENLVEQFYRLAYELGAGVDVARSVRDAVKKLK